MGDKEKHYRAETEDSVMYRLMYKDCAEGWFLSKDEAIEDYMMHAPAAETKMKRIMSILHNMMDIAGFYFYSDENGNVCIAVKIKGYMYKMFLT